MALPGVPSLPTLPCPSITEWFQALSLGPGEQGPGHINAWDLAGAGQPRASWKLQLEWGHSGCCASSTAGCGTSRPSPSAWAAEHIFYIWKTSIFLGSTSSCHRVDTAGFPMALSQQLSSGGPRSLRPFVVLGAEPGEAAALCSGCSCQLVPVVRWGGLLSSFLSGGSAKHGTACWATV